MIKLKRTKWPDISVEDRLRGLEESILARQDLEEELDQELVDSLESNVNGLNLRLSILTGILTSPSLQTPLLSSLSPHLLSQLAVALPVVSVALSNSVRLLQKCDSLLQTIPQPMMSELMEPSDSSSGLPEDLFPNVKHTSLSKQTSTQEY